MGWGTRGVGCAAAGIVLLAGLQTASAAVAAYGTAGASYTEDFNVMSSSASTPGWTWQNGAAVSANSTSGSPAHGDATGRNNAAATTGIRGTFAFFSTISGATPDFNAAPPGPRNFAGPDGIAPASWAAPSVYFATPNTGSRLYAFGSGTTNPVITGDNTDRALGVVVGSSTPSPGDAYLALVLQNATGQALTSFTLTYDGETWRSGALTTSPQGLLFSYKTTSTFSGAAADVVTVPDTDAPFDATANNNGWGDFTRIATLDYTPTGSSGSLLAVDGNAAANRTAGISATVTVNWAPGDYLILRWFENDDTGTDLGIGIDNLTFSAVPEPASCTTVVLIGGALLLLGRRKRDA